MIDTISRAVAGEENDADTFRDFYRHTGIELKRRGVTWARLDHGGHDAKNGPRGSSSKGDDVDVVWRLKATENGVTLHRDVARMSWVPQDVSFGKFDAPLHYQRLAADWPAGTGECANIMDRLDLPLDVKTRQAQRALQTIDEGRRREIVAAAIRWRKQGQAES
jgi:hypothetical protein